MANKPLPAPAQPSGQWHLQEVHALTQEHGVDPAHGLHVHQVNDRALQFGPNALPTADQRSLG
jgi:Ca2+-transporting ATPase